MPSDAAAVGAPRVVPVSLNRYDQLQCGGCGALDQLLLADGRQMHQRPEVVSFVSKWMVLHSNFNELDFCAGQRGCIACQVFRRSLLLSQASVGPLTANERILVRLRRDRETHVFEVFMDTGVGAVKAVVSLANTNISRSYARLVSNEPLHPSRIRRLREWISKCHAEHSCGNYKFSGRNPTWLLRILDPDSVCLVPGDTVRSPYVALSYCWGDESTLKASKPEAWAKIMQGYTTDLDKRIVPFAAEELAATIQDAIAFTYALGLEYIWCDSTCVPLGSWDVESNRMHEVYGNAYFTLSSDSTSDASERMLATQSAWSDDVHGCRLHNSWLLNTDEPLYEVRRKSPVSARSWTLQEERLSPRVLYYGRQRAYWACIECQHVEAPQPGGLAVSTFQTSSTDSEPQDFLKLCRKGSPEALRNAWCDIVSSYALRSLADTRLIENRYAAISGLAVRYLNARRSADFTDDYLAGLWRSSIAEDLSWTVCKGALVGESLQRTVPDTNATLQTITIPSWSWLSLPLRTALTMTSTIERSPYFAMESLPGKNSTRLDIDIVVDGIFAKTLDLVGRLKPFIMDSGAVLVPWESIERQRPTGASWFDFSFDPQLSLYARSQDARMLVYEPHREGIIGQLDYLAEGSKGGTMAHTVEVAYGQERDLRCFEVGKQAMLLLQGVRSQDHVYRRVGVAHGYREDFFDGSPVEKLQLI
ncbi:hypothetical protein LTR17_011907 [Elasticomyces elasticus]|nr:hypothetical protein LTR17_011907 [Elasticomyces elasticus]